MRLILEAHRHLLKLAETLDIDALMSVDQNVADRVVFQQRLDGTKAGQLVKNLGREILQLPGIQKDAFRTDIFADNFGNLDTQLLAGHALQHRKVEIVDQLAVQTDLGLDQLLLEKLAFVANDFGETPFHRRRLARRTL